MFIFEISIFSMFLLVQAVKNVAIRMIKNVFKIVVFTS